MSFITAGKRVQKLVTSEIPSNVLHLLDMRVPRNGKVNIGCKLSVLMSAYFSHRLFQLPLNCYAA